VLKIVVGTRVDLLCRSQDIYDILLGVVLHCGLVSRFDVAGGFLLSRQQS